MRASIIPHNGNFALQVNGEILPLYGYMTYLPHRGRFEAFRQAGVNLSFVFINMNDRGGNQTNVTRPMIESFWKGPDEYDFAPVQRAFETAGKAGAWLIPRIHTDPPSWWDKMHPEELCRSFQGEPSRASFSSRKRQEDVIQCLKALWDWCKETGWSERIVGWHIGGGGTEEFLRPTIHPGFMADYSAPAIAAWHRFMGKKIDPPTPMERMYAEKGELLDPDTQQLVIRYHEFLSVSMADAIIELCQAGHEITENTIPMGTFYGYIVGVTDPNLGHGALSRVLESEYVDFLASPFNYTGLRSAGTDWPIQGPVASVRLHGKPWFVESDIRTHLTGPLKDACPQAAPQVNRLYEGGVWAGPDTEEGSLWMMKKALGSILCQGAAAWWFDMWGGWYDSARMMKFQKQAASLFERSVYRSRAQVAVFLDETLIYRNLGGYGYRAHHDLLLQLSKAGAPYDVYERSDLSRVKTDQYRVFIFPDAEGDLPEADVPVRMGTGHGGQGLAIPGGHVDRAAGTFHFDQLAPSSAVLRQALLAAGVHMYSYTDDVCHAGGDFVCLHAATAGVKRVYLPREGTIRDAFTGENMNVSESFAEFDMAEGETRLFIVQSETDRRDKRL